ncbi:hypothetical protein [Acetobacter persici]|uniref:Uncharacterized protein n=1 Tax=Acetobacter persici TaxID=1076596 RepID=A0A6V8IB97_9PROT|nr:hypothetical protein [Acetobacter persici]GFE94870.1 hypothetical protein DmAi_29290 [Acetobacter persici]
MRQLVEYRNLTFASSDDGVLQIWFEAQCNEDNLLVRIYGHDRDTSFERSTPQVLTGWALYRSSKPKGLVSGIYASLRPHGSGGGATNAVKSHLDEARKSDVYAALKSTPEGLDIFHCMKVAQDIALKAKDFRKHVRREVFMAEKIAEIVQSGISVDEILGALRRHGGKNAE